MARISLRITDNQKFFFTGIVVLFISCICIIPDPSWALGSLQGVVRDEAGFAISGALVSSSPEDAKAVTKSNGSYEMAHSACSSNTVTASATGYDSQAVDNVSVVEGETTLLDFVLPGAPIHIETVYPSLGEMGKELDVTLHGTGFDSITKMSMYLDSGNRAKIIGSVDTGGSAEDVALSGHIAYVADGSRGLQVIDVSNSSQPFIIGSVDTDGSAEDVAISGNTAYVADGNGGLQIIDVSDPTQPVKIDEVVTSGSYGGISVVGNIAYVTEFWGGLQVIDVDPGSDTYLDVESVPISESLGVTVIGHIAYVAAGNAGTPDGTGLRIVDVDPDSVTYLEIIGSVDTVSRARAVTVSGNTAYVADNNAGIHIIDVSDSSHPFAIGSATTPGRALDVTVKGSIALVADSSGGLQFIDVDPGSEDFLRIIGAVDTPDAQGVAVMGNTAYVADKNSGLQVIDVSHTTPPTIIGRKETPGYARAVDLQANLAYIADNLKGLQVIDVNPASDNYLEIIGSVDTTDTAMHVVVQGNIAYVSDGYGGLKLIDISNPSQPEVIGSVSKDDWTLAQSVAVVGGIAYVAYSESGLLVIDLSDALDEDPNTIFDEDDIIESVYTGDLISDVTVKGNTAFVARATIGSYESRFLVIDLSDALDEDPTTLFNEDDTIGWIDLLGCAPGNVPPDGNVLDVIVNGNTAFVAGGECGLQVIDLSDALDEDPDTSFDNDDIIGSIDSFGYASNIFLIGNIVYVVGDNDSLQAVDVSDPAIPVLIGSVATPLRVYDIAVSGNTAYVVEGHPRIVGSTGADGLTLVPVPVELSGFSVISGTQINTTLPGPQIPGNYTIRACNNEEYDELLGAVTFTDNINLLTSKAIIVAGGGPFASGDIWKETKAYANYAYESLIYQGYLDEDIYYLTDETGARGRDAAATRENLKDAVTQWAEGDPVAGTSGLLIYLVDHGAREEFQIRGGADPQNVSAYELDSWLDTLQKNMNDKLEDMEDEMAFKVVLIYDACKSGSFISTGSSAAGAAGSSLISNLQSKVTLDEELSGPEEKAASALPVPDNTLELSAQSNGTESTFLPAIYLLLQVSSGDQDRIIIASSGSNQVAYFLDLKHSFSYHFWSTLSGKTGNEVNLKQAFEEASSTMSLYQTAQLDANGNGKANEDEDPNVLEDLEGTIYALRRQYSRDLTKPVVGIVSEYQTLQGTSVATLMARSVYDIDGDRIDRVWAEIIRPDYNPHLGDLTVTDIDTVELEYSTNDLLYEGVYDEFDVVGFYIINIYAEDAHGICSQPKTTLVIKE